MKDITPILDIARYTYLKREFIIAIKWMFNKFLEKDILPLISIPIMLKFPAYLSAWILHVVWLMITTLQSGIAGKMILVEIEDKAHGMNLYYKYVTDTTLH